MSTRNWTTIKEYSDILFDFYNGIARITINRPEVYPSVQMAAPT